MNSFIEKLATEYPFSYSTIDKIFISTGKDEQRTIKVLEQSLRLKIDPHKISTIFSGIEEFKNTL